MFKQTKENAPLLAKIMSAVRAYSTVVLRPLVDDYFKDMSAEDRDEIEKHLLNRYEKNK